MVNIKNLFKTSMIKSYIFLEYISLERDNLKMTRGGVLLYVSDWSTFALYSYE